jgi:APA family basic amino acid/polyamine antiporter
LVVANANGSLVAVFNVAILISTAAILVAYALCVISAVRLEFARDRIRPWQPFVALLALSFVLWALYGAGRDTWIWGGALLAAGVPIFLWQRHLAGR